MAYNVGKPFVSDGLVLCYDASNLRSYSGSGTGVVDLSGQNYNGTLTNGVGFNSGAFTFDGVNDYIDCGSTPIIGSTLSALTVSTWIYPTSRGTLCIAANGTNFAANTFYMFQENTTYFSFSIYGPSGQDQVNANFTYDLNTWYNLCAVWSSNIRLELYSNGQNCSGTRIGAARASVQNGNTNILIGIRNSTAVFAGRAGLFSCYNRALSAQEIQQNFQALRGRYGV